MIGRKLQNYKILSLLGEGGMGSVYKAFDVKLERYAALKILNLNSTHNSTFIERFKREARNQAKLMHPNIVSVFGFVEEKDVLGITMEYIEGDTLESIIRNKGRIEFSYALELMEQILTGIEFAHQQGFIHRDLKPSNIILDLNGNAKIMDFGISKSIEELKSITQHNARPGTLLYMSPEQLSGKIITIKSDLYALGITFYEMLVGVHPFPSQTIYEIIESHVNKIPARINSFIPSIPSEADDLILKAMNKAPENNFKNASEFKAGIINLKQIQLLNDNYADGRDVSWIWDVDFEKLKEMDIQDIFISGIRLYDMAIRLKIAGLNEENFKICDDFQNLTHNIIQGSENKVYVLATYTAMIGYRKFLHSKGYIYKLW